MKIKGIVFDMDGLMFDTESLSTDLLIKAAKELGINMTKEEAIMIMGFSADDMINFYCDYYKGVSRETITTMIHNHEKYVYDYLIEEGPIIKPGLYELLTYLKEHGYKMAVASSTRKPLILSNLEKAKVKDYFDIVVSGHEVEKSKPNPDVFLKAINDLGLTSDDVVILEDSKNGILAASRANARVINVVDLYIATDDIRAMCLDIVKDLTEVIPVLEKVEH